MHEREIAGYEESVRIIAWRVTLTPPELPYTIIETILFRTNDLP